MPYLYMRCPVRYADCGAAVHATHGIHLAVIWFCMVLPVSLQRGAYVHAHCSCSVGKHVISIESAYASNESPLMLAHMASQPAWRPGHGDMAGIGRRGGLLECAGQVYRLLVAGGLLVALLLCAVLRGTMVRIAWRAPVADAAGGVLRHTVRGWLAFRHRASEHTGLGAGHGGAGGGVVRGGVET